MKKIFTIALVLMATMTMSAQTITLSDVTPASNWYGVEGVGRITNKSGAAWSSADLTCEGSTGYKTGSSYFTVQTYQEISALTIWARSSSNRTVGKVAVSDELSSSAPGADNVEYTVTNENSESYAVVKNACDNEFTLTFANAVTANSYIQIVLSGNADIVAVTFGGATPPAPSTDPVSKVTISGPTAGYVGETVELEANFDATPDTIFWTVDGVLQESFTKKLSFELLAERTYKVVCCARNQYNDEDNWAYGSAEIVSTVKGDPVACSELYPATTGDTPAEGAKVALKENSYGGKIIFAGAKNNDFAASFQYNDYGLQMCKGSADFVRVELGFNLKNESIIRLIVRQDGLQGDKARGFKLNSADNKSNIFTAAWQQADETDLEKTFEYTVKTGDKLIGQNMFCIARSESAILNAVIVYDCGEALPEDTDPVTAATVAGASTALVGQTVKLTCTAEKADTYQWYLNETAIEGANAAVYNFAPEAAGEYSFYCTASNAYTATPVVSNTLVISVSNPLPQVDVTQSTIWDWTKASAEKEIKPTKNENVLLANVVGMNNNADFNSQALRFEGEYAIRDGKYCQGQLLQFHTTVAGYVSVEYSNTGNREKEEERRFLSINGTIVGGGAMRSDKNETEYNIPVEAGDVVISGAYDDGTTQYLRYYKLQFTTEEVDIPTALENVDASVKAVKVVRDGQLYIKKGDKLYNAIGSIVK